MSDVKMPASLIGNDILKLITTGMYNNPLAIYREYIQNAADSISATADINNSKVEIDIDPIRLRLKIRDNGPGLSHQAAIRALLPIAQSQKRQDYHRGFRGIGRLSALAFAESVTFTTRSQYDQLVTRIVWNGSKLRKILAVTTKMEHVIQECVFIEKLSGSEYPPHFFEVEVSNIGRYTAGLLLNRDVVRNYISEVCPVPVDTEFPFASKIEKLLAIDKVPLALDIFINGKSEPITRPYRQMIRFSDEREEPFSEFEPLTIPPIEGYGNAAVGWIAHSTYQGAIPKEAGIRGIRARVGNIQVGNETVFDHLFPEERFNRWCVGEIHVTDPRIIPNGRRDYFELGPPTRNLENHLRVIARQIAIRCRTASSTRNKKRKLQSTVKQIEETYDLAVSGYLSAEDAKVLAAQTLDRIQSLRDNMGNISIYDKENIDLLNELEDRLVKFQVRRGRPPFGSLKASDISTYRKVFQSLVEISDSPSAAKEMIELLLERA